MEKPPTDNSKWFWYILIGIIFVTIINTSGEEDITPSNTHSTSYSTTHESDEVVKTSGYTPTLDGYDWAEENDIDNFEACQDQFGTGYEEDECNRYVKENHTGYSSFNGYECTEDCSGHEAGYEYAEENGISDEYDCDGNSNSFNEGCISYVEENY